MNASAIIPEFLKLIPSDLHFKEFVYAVSLNLTKDGTLIGYAHIDQANACANTHKHRNDIVKQIVFVRKPDQREWRIYEYDNSCSRPRKPRLYLEDLTEEILSTIIFEESVSGWNCPKTDWGNC